MTTAEEPTKLTFKQAALSLLLQGLYFLMSPVMSHDDPRRMEIERLLNEADYISGDYSNIIQRHASHLSKEDCLDVIAYIAMLQEDDCLPTND